LFSFYNYYNASKKGGILLGKNGEGALLEEGVIIRGNIYFV
jgi:hypothetical protein